MLTRWLLCVCLGLVCPPGRVCVPFEAQDVDTFDPFKVPTLRTLAQQIDKFDREQGAEAAKATPGTLHHTLSLCRLFKSISAVAAPDPLTPVR